MNISIKKPSPVGLVLLAIVSVQFGSALAKSLFGELGMWGVVSLRVSFSTVVLFALWRLKWHSQIRQNFGMIVVFGVVFAAMNSFFYAAIDRIPLGIAISLEFSGPLGLAILKSQRWLDGLWVLLAGAGILLLTPLSGSTVDGWGIILALAAGFFWALYILLSAQVGQRLPGIEGLAWALAVSSVLLLPIGIATAGSALLDPKLLAMGAGVALLSTTVPYSFEMMALRSLPVKVFGIMLSLEPMAGVLAGFLVLGEMLSVRSLSACLLVSIAAAGAARFRSDLPAA
ncbi:EamA family transporter [Leptolyngbya sp. BC1307]|uniref:EamA family transporter n=1 Tax=Leptolyngbya sp. BC1307 TaxID=2029589 RepID=UPI000EFD239E|nr:EamA family transporter [Leptolyngbya sp. BC1307]